MQKGLAKLNANYEILKIGMYCIISKDFIDVKIHMNWSFVDSLPIVVLPNLLLTHLILTSKYNMCFNLT